MAGNNQVNFVAPGKGAIPTPGTLAFLLWLGSQKRLNERPAEAPTNHFFM